MMKNVLQYLAVITVFGVLAFITSCGKDDDPVVDRNNPTITLNAPVDGSIVVAGSQVASSIVFSDDTEISSASIVIGNGTVEIINEQFTNIGDIDFSFNDNLDIPADVVLGMHTVTITVVDAAGNSATATATIEAYPVYTDGMTTVLVTSVPDQVMDYTEGDAIRMVGTHQDPQWDVQSDSHPLTAYTDSEGATTYYQQIANTGAEFKFVRGLAWDMVQKDADGKESVNNVIQADVQKAELTIGSWRDYNPEVTNNSGGFIIVIDGMKSSNSHSVSGMITSAITTSSAISSASYSIVDESDMQVASGSLNLDAAGAFNETVDISAYATGNYQVVVTAEDAAGNMGREDAGLNIVDYPCDDTGEPAVAASETRIIVNVPFTEDNIYVTGAIGGVEMYGYASAGGTVGDPAYQLTKLDDGCYYIDLVLLQGDNLQFVRDNPGYADWWEGQATNSAGSDAEASFGVGSSSNGNTEKLYYRFWRVEP
jgi:hypothetical protein